MVGKEFKRKRNKKKKVDNVAKLWLDDGFEWGRISEKTRMLGAILKIEEVMGKKMKRKKKAKSEKRRREWTVLGIFRVSSLSY